VAAPIVVVGSLNMDFVARVDRLPSPGETVLGSGFRTIPGGKGANQACAAARLGGRVRMIGRVGDDLFGPQLREGLRASGVDVQHVVGTDGVPSGVALIVVGSTGQNQIVVAAGANARLTPADVEAALEEADADNGCLLLQLETPVDTVAAAAAVGKRRGMTVILDPAPARVLPGTLLTAVDILTPNETEACVLLGRRETEITLDEAPEIARAIGALAAGTAIVKLGAHGAFLSTASIQRHIAAPVVDAVDATAAGDTFNGALAVALSEGRPLEEAIAFANRSAALSVTRLGAQASIPTRAEVEE
jgi:ribokinase